MMTFPIFGKKQCSKPPTNKVIENKNLKNETVSWGITASDVASKTNKSDVSTVNIYHLFKRLYELGHHLVPMGRVCRHACQAAPPTVNVHLLSGDLDLPSTQDGGVPVQS